MNQMISVITANLWNDNPYAEADVHTLVSQGVQMIGLNEAWPYSDAIFSIANGHGYNAYGTHGDHPAEAILLQSRAQEVVWENRQTAVAAGGSQINRWGISAKFVLDDQPLALLNLHLNTQAQDRDWSRPATDIPPEQLQSYQDSVKVCADWADELRSEGFRTVVVGDLNWAYSTPMRDAWHWSPQKTFRRRAGMLCQFYYETLDRPKGDKRPVEYVFWNEDDFDYVGQSFVTPEHSDHPFHRVDLRIK